MTIFKENKNRSLVGCGLMKTLGGKEERMGETGSREGYKERKEGERGRRGGEKEGTHEKRRGSREG